MPRSKKGPRLFLRRRRGRLPVYVILDSGGHEESTGFGPGAERGAEAALARYLATKHESAVGTHDPALLPVSDLLTFYGDLKEPKPAASAAERRAYGITALRIDHLLTFFGDKATKDVRGALCRDYVRWRTHAGDPVKGWPARRPKPTTDQTARRELVILSAAIGAYHKEYGLDVVPVVSLPDRKATSRTALTHSEAAALLAGALGFYRDETGHVRRRARFVRTHRKRTARFIIIGLYSGTRHTAITTARWVPSVDAPWIDVDRGVLHRRGQDEADSKKRRPPARIPPRLLAHLRRWRDADLARGETYVLSRSGKPLVGQLRRGWAGARADAGLPRMVVPHMLRHTAGTWLAQGGLKARQAADYLGMSEETFERVYYHASPDYQADVGLGFAASKASASALRKLRSPAD